MQIAGMIIEYNPLHSGHLYLAQEVRSRLGGETALVGVMSGNYVQRGDFALVNKSARARAAVESGVDLVLELPLTWAVASAERFADGGVQTLMATGLVTHLAFGSECGDAAALQRVAAMLDSGEFARLLQEELAQGDSFAAARQRAVARLSAPQDAALLESPNNILGVEYCKSLLRRSSTITPFTVRRKGSGYHETQLKELPSATLVRDLLRRGETEQALSLMAPAMAAVYREEAAAGRAPVFRERCERALLARLRGMNEEAFAALDEGKEGVYRRLYQASREAVCLEELLEKAKTKRYAYTRLQRMVLWAWLGLTPEDFTEDVPYLRVLAANGRGRMLLSRMRETAALPVLTKPADVRELSEPARALFALESRATDLYTLAYPDLTAARGGAEWRQSPVIV